MDSDYSNYLNDCLEELIARAEEARKKSNATRDPFDQGISLGYYEVLGHLMSQAEIFGVKESFKKSVREYSPSL